jgi:outer membrane protein assembly factor BamB
MSIVVKNQSPLMTGVAFSLLLIGSILVASAQPSATVVLTSPNSQFNGEFGYSVAISGNMVVVGAPEENVGGHTGAGAAYIFNAQTGGMVARLVDPNSQYYGEFGYFVAIMGNDVVVGGDGNVYTFNERTGTLVATLQSPNSQDSEEVGNSLATSGNVVVVGAPLENVSGYAYAGDANISNAATGELVAMLRSPNLQYFGNFGEAVAASQTFVVVGAPGETVGGNSSAGRAYAFNAKTGTLVASLASTGPQFSGNFGFSVAISGSDAVVGAPGETVDGEAYAGRVYVFNVSSVTKSPPPAAVPGGPSLANSFMSGVVVAGIAVAAAGLVFGARRMKKR